MTDLEFKLKSEETRKRFFRLANKCEDLTPVWQKFIPEYKEIVAQNFEAKGKIMEQGRWTPLTTPYLTWKQKHYSGKPLLEVTGNLKTKAINFKSKVKKRNLIMEIEGEDYLFYVSERSKNPRKYFYTKDYNLPNVAWRILIQLANDELMKDME